MAATLRERAAGDAGVGSRPASPWRDLLRFRARVRPDVEVWVGIAAFGLVLGTWLLATETGLVEAQFLPSPLAVAGAWVGLFQNEAIWRTSASASAGCGSRSWRRQLSRSRSAC